MQVALGAWSQAKRLATNFLQDRTGSAAVLFGTAAIPIVVSVGVAVDYGHTQALRQAMQSAADAAALALVRPDGPHSNVSAQDYFQSVFVHPQVNGVSVSATPASVGGGRSLKVTASGSVKTAMMGLVGFSSINISVNSSAFYNQDGMGCVVALDNAAQNAILLNGSTTVSLNGCAVYSNSNSPVAVSVGGSASLSALEIGAVGGVDASPSNVILAQGIRTGQGPIADPYENVAVDPPGACTDNNFTAKTTITIQPGVYCNGITANAGAQVTLSPGIYYIDRGSLQVNGGAKIVGDGVTLVFTSSTGKNWATASINGNAIVELSPPTTGPSAGIVAFGDRSIPSGTTFKFNGGAAQKFSGAIYIPTGAVSFSGGVGTSGTCTQIIGATVEFTGNANLAIDCSAYKTKPFGPDTVRLTS
jgi:Flp pilus assembly protein TadG